MEKTSFFKTKPGSFASILQLVILLFGLVLAVLISDQAQKYIGRASTSPKPKIVKISNLTSSSFSVSFATDKKSLCTLILHDPQGKEQIVFDDRTSNYTSNTLFNVHHFTARNLTPDTAYTFVIQSGTEKYNDNGSDYAVNTLPLSSQTPATPIFLYGSVVDEKNLALTGALVYLSLNPPENTLSFLTDQNGNFIFDLVNLNDTAQDLTNKTALIGVIGPEGETFDRQITLTGTDQSLDNIIFKSEGNESQDKGVSLIPLTNDEKNTTLNTEPEAVNNLNLWQKIMAFFQKLFSND